MTGRIFYRSTTVPTKLFGLQDHEVVGKNILTLERGQEVQELLQKVAVGGSGESLYQKDGAFISYAAAVLAVKAAYC